MSGSPRELELEDTLSDVATGIKIWRDRKMAEASLDITDELLLRWLEAGPGGELL